ncbi:MAG: CZB domain-containing protein [Proteobacteria bacterium]|nr:CZB domain-containing protein [Pseudomonadota bacterium]
MIARLEERFCRFNESAKITLASANYAQDLSFSSLVKVDHVIYKQRAYTLINSPDDSELRKAISVDHHNCRMGKWYDGAGRAAFGDFSAYRTMQAPHSKVHGSVHKTLALLDSGWEYNEKVQASIVAELTEVETASSDVMEALNRMVAEKHPDLAKGH